MTSMETRGNAADEAFRNLISYDQFESPFVDRFSQFGVVFDAGRPLGPGMLQVRSVALHQSAADALLTLWIGSGSETAPVSRRMLECLPWRTRERGDAFVSGGKIEVEADHSFLDQTRLVSRFVFRSAGTGIVRFRPFWAGHVTEDRYAAQAADPMAHGGLRRFGLGALRPRETVIRIQGKTIEAGLVSAPEPFLPSPLFRVTSVSGPGIRAIASVRPFWYEETDPRNDRIEGLFGKPVFYRFSCDELSLAPGQEVSFTFLVELSVATWLDRAFLWKGTPEGGIDPDAIAAGSKDEFLSRVRYDALPPIPEVRMNRFLRSRWALLRTGYRADGRKSGEFGSNIASTCVPNSGGFTRAFFWDAFFSSASMSAFDPEFAKGAIRAQFSRQLPDGHCPEHAFNYHVSGRDTIGAPQAPVATWAVEKYLSNNPSDGAFLTEIYPLLERNHRYWTGCGDRDGDGLAEWTWSGQTADSSPLWDEFRMEKQGCNWLPPVASVQLNAFLYRDAMTLARLAEMLGKAGEASAYRASASARRDALMKHCYIPEENRFWDYFPATGRHTKVKTFYLFWPIWAGMDMPAGAKKDLIENVLLDPAQFFGAVPFPSVAYDEPSYENCRKRAYWRGAAWPHITYWLLEMLVREGYRDAAEEAARRFLAVYDREPSFPEHISSDPSYYDAGGAKDYNWGVAAYELIARGAYRVETGS